jgi:hypothetical protein
MELPFKGLAYLMSWGWVVIVMGAFRLFRRPPIVDQRSVRER